MQDDPIRSTPNGAIGSWLLSMGQIPMIGCPFVLNPFMLYQVKQTDAQMRRGFWRYA